MIKTDLLSILVCPDSRAPLLLTADGRLVSADASSRRVYRIDEGIPVLLVDESQVLAPEDHARLVAEANQLPANQKAAQLRNSPL